MNESHLQRYIMGFIFSIVLTVTAFMLVTRHLLSGMELAFVLVILALIQAWIQVIFFIHLDMEDRPRWNLAAFLSTISIILILVVGSLWIMYNLNYSHMPSTGDILQEEGIKK